MKYFVYLLVMHILEIILWESFHSQTFIAIMWIYNQIINKTINFSLIMCILKYNLIQLKVLILPIYYPYIYIYIYIYG